MRITEAGSAGHESEGTRNVLFPGIRGNGTLERDHHDDLATIDLFRVFVCQEAREAAARVMTPDEDGRTYVGQGPEVDAFEREFAALVGSDRPILALNSGTSAITLALHLAGVGHGDWVISTPMTCSASNTPVVNLGAHIIWADVDPHTGCIDPESVKKILHEWHPLRGRRPKAIIAVDWAGQPCDYTALKSFGLPVIQDAAHRVFALDTPAGDYVCWSHQAIKHLTTIDGGSLLVPEDQYRRAKLLRWYGLDRESGTDFRCAQSIQEAGFKYHMNDVSAAIGRANMKYTREIVNAHRKNAAALTDGADDRFYVPKAGHDFWFFPVLVKDRDEFMRHMKDRGIATSQVH